MVLILTVTVVPVMGQEDRSVDTGGGFLNSQGVPSILPMTLQRNLSMRFGVEEGYESGILNGRVRDEEDTYTEASAAFFYNLRRKRSEYVFDYRGGARHYRQNSNLDALSHDFGLSQIRQLTSRLTWTVNYRYGFTPDYYGGLTQENLAREYSLVNPIPTSRVISPTATFQPTSSSLQNTFVNPLPSSVSLLPTTVNTLPQTVAPGDGLIGLRSIRMTNHATTGLSYQLSYRTSFFTQAGYQRTRYQDPNLFNSDGYNVSAGIRHAFTARTEVGLAYQGSRSELSRYASRVVSQGVVVSLNRQLTRSTFVTLSAGPMLNNQNGQEVIPLSPLLSNLLGRSTLSRDASQQRLSWMGNAGLSTQLLGLNLSFGYDRLVSATGGLGGSSLRNNYSASMGRRFGRRTSFSVSASYLQSDLYGISDRLRYAQQALDARFSRQVSSGLDFVLFARHSKMLQGFGDSFRYNHNQFGIGFQYHLPRVGVM
jgi:hypothetical protein